MPRPQKIFADEIETAAFELVRTQGIDALTVRALAQALGCSTQPVYSACKSMEHLRSKIVARTQRFVAAQLDTANPDAPPLLQLGFATLRLARDEPHLYRLAFDPRRKHALRAPDKVLQAMQQDKRLACLPREALDELHAQLWIFTSGLAQWVSANNSQAGWLRACALLQSTGETLISHTEKHS